MPLRGDGSDPLPTGWYAVQLRNGEIWDDLIVTDFCRAAGKRLFQHRGSPTDPLKIWVHDPSAT